MKYGKLKMSANDIAILPFFVRMGVKLFGHEYAVLVDQYSNTRIRRAYFIKGLWMAKSWGNNRNNLCVLNEDMTVIGTTATAWMVITDGLFDFVNHDNTKPTEENSSNGNICRQ